MRRIFALVFVLALTLVPFGIGSPTTGSFSEKPTVGAEPWSITKEFRGGERASVIVVGRAEEPLQLQVSVYDAKGKLIAEDKGPSDFVSVIWYPPRTADYKVEVRNLSRAKAKCYVAFK